MTGTQAEKTRRVPRLLLSLAAAATGTVVASGCGATGVTAPPLNASIATTFTNLYALQQREQGNPVPPLSSLQTHATCLKGTPSTVQSGAGNDWTCQITYLVAGPATPITALYNVNVQTDGCYAADGDGPASVNGSRTITGVKYQQTLNPLWLIDGCFDVG